jgi:hypothetical protein
VCRHRFFSLVYFIHMLCTWWWCSVASHVYWKFILFIERFNYIFATLLFHCSSNYLFYFFFHFSIHNCWTCRYFYIPTNNSDNSSSCSSCLLINVNKKRLRFHIHTQQAANSRWLWSEWIFFFEN